MGKTKYFLFILLISLIVAGLSVVGLVFADKVSLPQTKAEEKSQSSFGRVDFDFSSAFLIRGNLQESLSLDKDPSGHYQKEKIFQSSVISSTLEFNAVGARFREQVPKGTSLELFLRASDDSINWSPWFALTKDEDPSNFGEIFSDLVAIEGKYLQYKAILKTQDSQKTPLLEEIKFTFIDSRKGPDFNALSLKNQAQAASTTQGVRIISRSQWGANPRYMTWRPEYTPVKKFILHHTASSNNPPDPAAHMRAIYYYHAVTRGWGDIGYNFVIDQYGNIYEGRYGGDNVVGAHAYGFNYGTCGISVMGTFISTPLSSRHLGALTDLIAAKGYTYQVAPAGRSYFTSSVYGRKYLYNVSGHRDVNATACPGDAYYRQLPYIREVADQKYKSGLISLTSMDFSESVIAGSKGFVKFVIKNQSSTSLVLDCIRVAVREVKAPYGIYSFDPVKPPAIDAGESRSFYVTKTFNKPGKYKVWIYYYLDGGGYVLSGAKYMNVYHIKDKLKLSSLSLSPSNPAVGEQVTATFSFKNESSSDITLDFARATSRNIYSPYDAAPFDLRSSILVPAGGDTGPIQVTRTFSRQSSYKFWVYFYYNGKGYVPNSLGETPPFKYIRTVPLSSKISLESFQIDPKYPVKNIKTTFNIKVKNHANCDIALDFLRLAIKETISPYSVVSPKALSDSILKAGQTKLYSFDVNFSKSSRYKTWVYYYLDGRGYKLSDYRYFTVYKTKADLRLVSFSVPGYIEYNKPGIFQFSVKNFGEQPLEIDLMRLAIRGTFSPYPVASFRPIGNIFLGGGAIKTYKMSKSFDQSQGGRYEAWIYYYQEGKGYVLSGCKYFQVISADLPPGPTVKVTGNGNFEVRRGVKGDLLSNCLAGEEVHVAYNGGWFYIKTKNFYGRTGYPVRIVPKNSTIIEVLSYKDPNWNNTLNFNRFRGVIEICRSSVTGKIWVVNELPLEYYLRGVAETSNNSHYEFLRAMAIAERSYALYHIAWGGKHRGEPFHLKNSRRGNGSDQIYIGYNYEKDVPRIVSATGATAGQVVTYGGRVVITPYSSGTDGKRTRSWSEVWGSSVPWCVSVPDPYGYIPDWKTRPGNHMVGLSTKGALGYAEKGSTHTQILNHYYKNTKVSFVNTGGIKIRVAIYRVD